MNRPLKIIANPTVHNEACYYDLMGESFANYSPEQREELTPSQEVARALSELGKEHGFDPQICAEIAELPFDEAFCDACAYLAQAGLDEDEILSQFTENPTDNSHE